MEQKGITNQLFASANLSIKQEVHRMESKDAPTQLSAPPSSINIKLEVDSKCVQCETDNDSKNIPGYNIESTCIKTEHMCLLSPYDTKDHLKLYSRDKDGDSDHLHNSSVIEFTDVTEPTTSGFTHMKTEKYHDDHTKPTTRYQTEVDTTRHIVQSGWSDTKEQRDVSETDTILPGHLETNLLESAGGTLLGEVTQSKRTPNCHHSKRTSYRCEICQKSFSTKSDLFRHKLTHTKEKPFECDICQKSFSRKFALNAHHQSVHCDIRPYRCAICQKSFCLKSHLNTHHQRVHSTNLPHKCDICQKSFSWNSELLRHKLTHTKEKPFQCDICQKSFKIKQNMITHKLTHTENKQWQCDICLKSFSLKGNMMRHKLTHTEMKQC